MNSARGAKSPSNHDLNIFLDRQIQNKLLEIDDQLWLTDYMVESKGNTELKVPKTIKVTRNEDVTGWFSSSKCVLRKLEKEKPTPQPITYSWREQTRLKNLIQNSFVFKHYPYHQSYIEQYREENSQLSGIKTVAQKESNEPRKIAVQNTATITSAQNNTTASGNIYSQNSGQNICNHCNQPYTVSTSQPLITAAFSYTRRETTSLSNGACKCSQSNSNPIPHSSSSHTCTKHNHHQHKDVASLAYKYKLSKEALMHNIAWKSESDNSSEHERDSFKTPRVASGKRSAGKAPTKVTVPSLPNGHNKNIQTVTVSWRLPRQQISQGKPSGDGLSVATTQQNLRALDALSCVAAEKQLPEKPESKNGSLDGSQEHLPTLEDSGLILPEDIAVISDEASDVISISKLSTICLGADMKTRENDGLEPSCAIQLFPNNDIMIENAMRVLNSGTVVWRPSASVTPSQKEKIKKEFTLHNPSPTITHKIPDLKDSQKVSTNLHRSQSEARIDFPIIRTESRSGMLVSDINMSKQAKLGKNGRTSSSMETRAPLIPKGNVMKNLRHKYAGYVRSKNLRKTKSETTLFSLPKPSPPPTDGRSCSVKPYPSEYTNFPDNMKVSQVYTLWSTDGNRSTFTSSDMQSATGTRYQDEDERRLQKVAQYILNEHLDSSIEARMKQEVAVADGMWFDTAGRAYVSLAARYDPLKK
ncbi:uncharacterized protein LOC143063236 isoform X5 [Mytilus galloprovincialis]|uniref:uncharacterized protein LOC143063236 isoform X5 n=1 Tax=Mytilus galloprovincialis TaxID=29158 RepID=UPI003F7C3BE5